MEVRSQSNFSSLATSLRSNCSPCVRSTCELILTSHYHYPIQRKACPLLVATGKKNSKLHAFASMGFNVDPRPSIERAANGLLKDAASLLLYQDVLRIPPAQAFLKVLLALRRGEDGWKLLDAYGEFYRLMAAGYFSSWEDLVLEGILLGDGNPFAEACASAGNPCSNSRWCGGVPSSLQAAAATDLDSLQRLSIAESTLVGWVTELVPDVRQEWKVAAESTLSTHSTKKVLVSAVNWKNSAEWGSLESEDRDLQLEQSSDENLAGNILVAEDTSASVEREMWRRKIGGLWKWSDAVPLLLNYYSTHGIGKTACEQALECKGGKLLQHSCFNMYKGAWQLSCHHTHRQKLTEAFKRHARGHGPEHILVRGAPGSGKSWLVQSTLHKLVVEGQIKSLVLPRNELKHLQGVLEELAKNWQLRFVLVADGVSGINDLTAVQWPENVLLCAISTLSGSTEEGRGPFLNDTSDMFGTTVALDSLDEDGFLKSVDEIMECKKQDGQGIDERIREQATAWANNRKVLTVRGAAQFVRSIV